MTKVIAVDPQVHFCAWVYTREFKAQAVGIERDKTSRNGMSHIGILLRACTFVGAAIMPDVVIVEYPRVYPFKCQKGDQNDLIRLAVSAGVVGAAFAALSPNCELIFVEPRQWKGTIDKEPQHKRLRRDYPHIEPLIAKINKGMRHHVLDAAALAFWHLERTRANGNTVTPKSKT